MTITITYTLWMKKTANFGAMFPRAKVFRNNTSGTLLCTTTGTTALTTTLTKYTLTCTTGAAVSLVSGDRLYLWVGVNVTTAPGNNVVKGEVDIEGTLNGNFDSLIVVPLPPSISSLSPTSGAVGTAVTINGSNFGASQGTSSVTYNGVAATPTSWSGTSIAAPVPAGATTGSVVVTVGGATSAGVSFTVSPSISGLSPTTGPVATPITVSGANFGATQGTSTIKFNGVTATPTSWSATSIVAPVPATATTGSVVVTVGGIASNGVTFTVAPKINSLAPTSGVVGTSVTISGSTFGATQGASTVKFNGITATPSSWSAASIAAPVPAGAATGPVVVTVAGVASNGVTFTVITPPSISGLSPTTGAVGTPVTVNGVNFGATQGTSTVKFNGVTATPTSWSNASIAVPVPASATTGPVVVTVGGIASNGVSFTIITPPSISGTSPTSGVVGTAVTVSGSNFGATQGSSTVKFNGVTATPTSWSTGSIAAPVPSGATTGSVIVTVAGVASNGVTFTVITTGAISGTITKSSDGSALSGALIEALQAGVVKGSTNSSAAGSYSLSGLNAGTYDVRVSATSYVTSSTNGVVVTAGGTATVNAALNLSPGGITGRVTQSDGTTAIPGATVRAYKNVSLISSGASNASGDYLVQNLSPGVYMIEVSAIGYEAQSVNWLNVSNGNTETVNFSLAKSRITYTYDELGRLVAVTDPLSDTAIYNYDAVGNLLSISRQTASGTSIIAFTPKAGGVGTPVTISGTGFSPTAGLNTVKFNGVTAVVTSATSTQLVAVVPTGATTGAISVTSPTGTATSTGAFTVGTPTGSPAITSVSPTIAGTGQAITITGTGFETLASNDRVYFNTNLPALVTAATATSITANVPNLAVAGPLRLETPSGNAVSAVELYPSSSPANVEVASRMVVGETRNISLSAANKIAYLIFDAAAGKHIALNMPTLTQAGCCLAVTVIQPNGSTLTNTLNVVNLPFFLELPILPSTGTYTISMAAGSQTSVGMQIVDELAPDLRGSIVPGGPVVPLTISTPMQNARLTFNGTANRQVILTLSGVSIGASTCCSAKVTIYKPDSSVLLAPTDFGTSGLSLSPLVLPVSGVYTILLDPTSLNIGSVTVKLDELPGDIQATITPGGPTVPISVVSQQNANLTFNGTAGQRVSLLMPSTLAGGTGFTKADLNIYNPDGSALVLYNIFSSDNFLSVTTLPVTGVYRIFLDPLNTYSGTVNFTLYDVPPDQTVPITPSGSPVTGTITTPGQKVRLTFSGSAGQRISMKITGSTMGTGYVSLLQPDGSPYWSGTQFGSATLFLDPTTLFDAGTYTVLLETGLNFTTHTVDTGSATVTLYNVPADVSGTVTVGGAAVPITITVPGQNGQLTFNGNSGQVVTVRVTGNTMGSVNVSLVDTNGSTLASSTSSSATFNLAQKTLAAAGTYTININPQGANIGTLNITVTSP